MLVQVRNLLSQLRPHGLEGLQMVDALNDLVRGWRGRVPEIGIEAEFPPSLPPLPPHAGLALPHAAGSPDQCAAPQRGEPGAPVPANRGQALELTVADNGVGKAEEVVPRSAAACSACASVPRWPAESAG
jgi:two-component system sensor histidine kinase UhpB